MSELDALKLLRRIEEGVAGKSGEPFFKQIICDLADALGAHAAFTSSLNPDRTASMLAFWVGDHFEPCLTYSLVGTPCEFVYKGQIVSFARNIGETFPVDRAWFEQLGVNSYLGIPIKGETGDVVGHLAVMDKRERDWREADLDVLRLFSLRSAVELERSRYHAHLEAANQKLTEEITQRQAVEKQLEAAKQVAEQANQAKSVFITQMSHELRTPLNGILGYAQLLKNTGALNEEQRDGLEVIARSGEHLLTLVNDLLDLAKIESGKLELRNEAVNLPELLRHVCDLIRMRAQNAELTFITEEAGTLPPRVIGDARALRQMLINLLGNAVKFTARGGRVALRVSSQPRLENRCQLHFAIEDTGVGIAADQLESIFEPFHRVIDEQRSVEGTGLGLAITRRLALAMNGEITVASQPGVGSTFDFSVALDLSPQEQIDKHTDARVTGYEGVRRRVLIADDDPVNRTLVYRLLSGLGFEMHRASNGLEALQLIKLSLPDLLITDLVMPQVDGMELVRTLRADSRTQALPVIALSASASEYSRDEALRQGCNAFVAKPLRLPLLLDQLGALLHLDWRRDTASVSMIEADAETECTADYLLDPMIAGELGNLAMQGDIETLTSRLRETLAGEPAAQSLYAQIISHAEHYDMRAIRQLLSSHTVRGSAAGDTAAR